MSAEIPMCKTDSVVVNERLLRVWSSRKERNVIVHVQYEVKDLGGCQLYTLLRIEEAA
jgi:hypothetical protein